VYCPSLVTTATGCIKLESVIGTWCTPVFCCSLCCQPDTTHLTAKIYSVMKQTCTNFFISVFNSSRLHGKNIWGSILLHTFYSVTTVYWDVYLPVLNLVVVTIEILIGDRAFCVAGPRVWNSLSSSMQSAPSLLVFRRLLKCELFHRCYDLC